MCYSSLLEKAYDEYLAMFAAPFDLPAFRQLYRQREIDLLLKIPPELDEMLVAIDPLNAAIIRESGRQWRENCASEMTRLEEVIAELSAALPKKATAEQKRPVNEARTRRRSVETALKAAPSVSDTYRIYPKYFVPLILSENGDRKTVPARYRVLPRNGVEYPPEYNVYNAVREMLTVRKTWKPLFGKTHAIFPFIRFYEWLMDPKTHKKVEVSFSPDNIVRMWAACLYEEFQSPRLGLIRSFAMVTDNPPPEVAAAGHDRCPVFIQEDFIDAWLKPEGSTLEFLNSLLDHKTQTYFANSLVA